MDKQLAWQGMREFNTMGRSAADESILSCSMAA